MHSFPYATKTHYPNYPLAEIPSCNKAQHYPSYPIAYKSNEPVESEGRGGIVSAVVEGRNLVVFPGVVALLEEGAARGVQGADGLKGKEEGEIKWRTNIMSVKYKIADICEQENR